MLTKNTMLENFTDRMSVIIGATGGAVIANTSLFADYVFKFIATIIFAFVGAVVGFYVKRYLEKKCNNKN